MCWGRSNSFVTNLPGYTTCKFATGKWTTCFGSKRSHTDKIFDNKIYTDSCPVLGKLTDMREQNLLLDIAKDIPFHQILQTIYHMVSCGQFDIV
jgi:hypothetical protein